MSQSSTLEIAAYLAARAYSDAHFDAGGNLAEIARLNELNASWAPIGTPAQVRATLNLPPSFDVFDLNGHLTRVEMENASATFGLMIVGGEKTLGVSFEGTNFGTEVEDLWDDIVNIDSHSRKLTELMAGLDIYASNSDNGIQKVLFSGHSLGGSVAQYYMGQYADDYRYMGVTFGTPGTTNAPVHGADRIWNFAHTVDPVPPAGVARQYVISGYKIHLDQIWGNADDLSPLAEHLMFSSTSQPSYVRSIEIISKVYVDVSEFGNEHFTVGSDQNDAIQNSYLSSSSFTGKLSLAAFGAGGNDRIGEHSATSNDNEDNVLVGGLGNDILFIDNIDDVIFEQPNEGSDTVVTYISRNVYLEPNIEVLRMALDSALWNFDENISGWGNEFKNKIIGNNANNTLRGFGDSDTIDGLKGQDHLYGGAEDDFLMVIDGNDKLYGGAGDDSYTVSRVNPNPVDNPFSVPTYIIDDESGNRDSLTLIDVSGKAHFDNFATDLRFMREGNSLFIDFDVTPEFGLVNDNDGRVEIVNMADTEHRIETLYVDFDGQPGVDHIVSLPSIWLALSYILEGRETRLQLADGVFSSYGQLVM